MDALGITTAVQITDHHHRPKENPVDKKENSIFLWHKKMADNHRK